MNEQRCLPLPKEFLEKMQSLLGAEYQEFIESYDKERVYGLRFNPLKWEKGITASLSLQKLRKIPWAGEGYYYQAEAKPGKHSLHQAGAYYIQEPSAMAAVELLEPEPGERTLDLCAAPGGKTTQIAAKMKQKGLLVSNEIHPSRAKILSRNVERMGIANAVVVNEDSGKLAAYFPEFFDKILVDAPCSGEGMFRKDEEARQEWSLEHVKMCAIRQAEILDNAASMLKPGGRLVYSTCTFSPEENEGSIQSFLNRHPDFYIEDVEKPAGFEYFDAGRPEWVESETKTEELLKTFRVWPHKTEGEGHFFAVMRKKGRGRGMTDQIETAADKEDGSRTESIRIEKPKSDMAEGREQGSRAESPRREKGKGYETIEQIAIATGRKQGGITKSFKLENPKPEGKKTEKLRSGKTYEKDRELSAALKAWQEFVHTSCSASSPIEFSAVGSRHFLKQQPPLLTAACPIMFGEQLYLLPPDMPDMQGLKILRPGLALGIYKKNRFEPSHSLAMYLKKEQVKQWISLDSDGMFIQSYLKGGTIDKERLLTQKDEAVRANLSENGWVLVLADDCSVGWAKLVENTLKNHYPKGLRLQI